MGAHTAFLAAHARPDLVSQLIMLEGHVAGGKEPEDSQAIGEYFRTWPRFFGSTDEAKQTLGNSPLGRAWTADLEATSEGLQPRFDADIMESTIAAVHYPRWQEWESLTVLSGSKSSKRFSG
ncbi:hypothetical protein GCM10025777_40340 [Membranihabitans marinus]|uniref:AB hydrolase-1 domain-containing protein n=1 Tax=Nesterenkonia rhizosphaerae TaxID=1348272 RepID=A0ABP9FYY4_9MICC